MKIKDLIYHLSLMDPDMPVCGQSETGTWDIESDELVPSEDVVIMGHNDEKRLIVTSRYPKALILGYKHG